jgi:hypothetical protein
LLSVHAAAGWSIEVERDPPAGGPVSALAEGAKSSMFAEMPLDNRTMKETATRTPRQGHRDLNPPNDTRIVRIKDHGRRTKRTNISSSPPFS